MGLRVTLAELISAALDTRARNTWTAEPCIVQKFDAATETVDVQPALQRTLPAELDGALGHETLPIVSNVPVMFFAAGDVQITCKINKGDEGLLVFTSSASGAFREKGTVTPAGDLRRNALGSAMFFPARLSKLKVTGVQAASPSLVIGSPMTRIGSENAELFAAVAEYVDDRIATLQAAYDGHKHGGITTGSGSSAVPDTIVGPLDSVKCDKVKIE